MPEIATSVDDCSILSTAMVATVQPHVGPAAQCHTAELAQDKATGRQSPSFA